MKQIKAYEDFVKESKVNEAAKLDLQNDIFDRGKGGYKDWKFEPEKKKLTVTYDIGKWDDKGRYAKEIKWLATNDRSSIGSGNQLVGYLDLYLEPHGLEVDKKKAHKYDPNTGKVELNLTDYTPGGNSYGHSVWENEVNEKAFNAEEIFFLWDETVDDDREGIESGHTDHRGKAATVFSFDAKDHKAFMDFKKKAAEYLKKQGLKHEDTGEQLFVYESSDALSEAAFSVEDGIKIQSEQLAQWKKLLQPKVYKDLEKWATEHNDKAESGNQIIRGTDLDNFIGNYFNSYTPSNKR